MNRDPISISILLRRWNNRSQRNIFEFADSSKNIAHLPPFYRQLMLVVDVLVCASAATAKIGTFRADPVRRAFFYFHEFRLGESLFLVHDLSGNQLGLDRIRDEDSLSLFAADAFPAESNVFNSQIDNAHTSIKSMLRGKSP